MSHYETLGVGRDATPDELRAAYRRGSSAAHPDREGGSTERQAALNRAWQILGDAESRARYDATGDDTEPNTSAELATMLLANLFRQAVEVDRPDWLQAVGQALEDQHAGFQQRTELIKARVAKLQRRRDKVAVKEGENLAHAVIDQAIAHADGELRELGLAIDVNRLAAVALANYQSTEEPPVRVTVVTSSILTGWHPESAVRSW